MSAPALQIRGLSLRFGDHLAVRDLALEVGAGQFVALVGESGSGKSLSALSIGRLQPETAKLHVDELRVAGQDMSALDAEQLRSLLGDRLAYIFQEPMTALNPVLRIRTQMSERLHAHRDMSRAQADQRCLEMLAKVQIRDPERIYQSYPHHLSGGLRQRVMIATALLLEPALLIADEPTTALDVTVQREILDLLKRMQRELGTAILFITHDLDLVRAYADRVAVMYAGTVVETGPARAVLDNPQHPYTQGLLVSTPRFQTRGEPLRFIPGRVQKATAELRGCAFAPRCPFRTERCTHDTVPDAREGTAACHYPRQGLDLQAWQHNTRAPSAAG